MLFHTWTVDIYYCPRNGIFIHMDFHLEWVSQLTESGDVTQLLEALCRQMEHFLDNWKEFVSRKCREHFYLNFYMAEQPVHLSTKPWKQSPSEASLMMLSFIKDKCTPAYILRATEGFNEATRDCVRRVMEELPPLQFSKISLVTKLKVIMEQSLEFISVFLFGCLDLEALGHCLDHLARICGPPVEWSLLWACRLAIPTWSCGTTLRCCWLPWPFTCRPQTSPCPPSMRCYSVPRDHG